MIYKSPLSDREIPTKKFTTNDRHFESTFTPPVDGGPILVELDISDYFDKDVGYGDSGIIIHGPNEDDYVLNY